MEELFKIPALDPEQENVAKLKRLKSKLWSKFKISTKTTQLDFSDLVIYLWIFERFSEIKEVAEFILAIPRLEVDSAKAYCLSTVYSCYLQLDHRFHNPVSYAECKRRFESNESYPLNTFEHSMTNIKQYPEILITETISILRLAIYHLALDERSRFSKEYLRVKIEYALSILRKHYKASEVQV